MTGDVGYAKSHQLSRWLVGTQESADDRYSHNEDELVLGERQGRWHPHEHTSLHSDTPPNACSNHDSRERRTQHQDKGFVHEQLSDDTFGESDGSHDGDLLALLVEVSSHRGRQREEADEHGDGDHNVEDHL